MLRRSAERGERPVRPLRSKSFSINAEVETANGNTATVELPTSTSRWRRSLSTCVQGQAPSSSDTSLPIKPASPTRHGPIEQDAINSPNIIGNLATGTASPPRNRVRPQLRRASVPKNVSFAPASVSRKLRPRIYSSPSQDIYVRHEPAVVIIDPDAADMNTSSEDSMVRVFTRASFESQADMMSWRGSDSSAPTSPRPPSSPNDGPTASPAKGPVSQPLPIQTPIATRRRTLGLRSGITGTPSRTSIQPHVSLSSSATSRAPPTAPLNSSAKVATTSASAIVTQRLRSRPASPASASIPVAPPPSSLISNDIVQIDARPSGITASPTAGCKNGVVVDALDAVGGLDWSTVDSDTMHLAFAGHSTVKPARAASKLTTAVTTEDGMAGIATTSSSSSISCLAIPTRSRAGVFIPREAPRTADADECLWDIPSQRSVPPALPAAAISPREEAAGDDSTVMSAGDLSAFLSRGDLRLPWADGSAALDASAGSDEVTLHLHLSPGTVTVDARHVAPTTTSANATICATAAPLSRSKRLRSTIATADEDSIMPTAQADGLDVQIESTTTTRSKRARRSHDPDTLNDSSFSTVSHATVSASPALHSPPTTRSRMRARAMTGSTSDASQSSVARAGETDRSTSSNRTRTKARSRAAAHSAPDAVRASPSHSPAAPSAPACYDARQLALAFPTAQLPASTLDAEQARAVDTLLGPCVANLGYKRIHVASARVLTSSVPVWCHQRPCDPDRVRAISEAFYRESDMTVPQLLGTVCAYALPVGGRVEVGLFDGQHRVQAMALLLRRRQDDMVQSCLGRNEPPPTLDELMRIDFPIVVEVWGVRSQFHIAQLYRSVNLAEPVQDVDMHLPFLGYGDAAEAEVVQRNRSHKSLIAEAVGALADKHRTMFKISTRCVPPHVNADVMRNNIYVSQLCGVLNITTAAQLLQLLTTTNASLASVPAAHWPLRSRHAALAKARTHGFYLGLDNYAWLDALVERAEKGEVSPSEMEPTPLVPAPSGPAGGSTRSAVDASRTRATTGPRTVLTSGSHSTAPTHKPTPTITANQRNISSRLGVRAPASRALGGDTKVSSRK